MLLYGEKGKIMDFSETIVVYDIKVGRFSQLNVYLYEYQCGFQTHGFDVHVHTVTEIFYSKY